MSLNARQEAFCQSYARYGNATRAAKEAGYSERTAYQQGFALLKHPEIPTRLVEIKEARFKALHMSADEALAEIARVARASIGTLLHLTPDGDPYVDLGKADDDTMAAIAEATIEDFTDGREVDDEGNTIKRDVRRVKVKMHNKIGALTLIAKAHGLLTDKVEHSFDGEFSAKMAAAFARSNKGGDDGRD